MQNSILGWPDIYVPSKLIVVTVIEDATWLKKALPTIICTPRGQINKSDDDRLRVWQPSSPAVQRMT